MREELRNLFQAQIRNELENSQQYLAIAVLLDANTLPQLAKAFYAHAHEERNHALRFVQYMIDRREEVRIPALRPVANIFECIEEALRLAVTHEREVTGQICNLVKVASETNDYLALKFLDWFLREQVEEEAFVDKILAAAVRAGGNLLQLESFVHREIDRHATPGAPNIAGSGAV
jgi:bacterioferritin B